METITAMGNFLSFLGELMEDTRMNIPDLAEKLNCDEAAIRRWTYKLYFPDSKTLIKVSETFNISADYMFGFSDFKEFHKNKSSLTFYQRYLKLKTSYKEKLSDYTIAKNCKLRQSTITKWKNGNTIPETETLLNLAEFFDCSMDYLLGQSESENRL